MIRAATKHDLALLMALYRQISEVGDTYAHDESVSDGELEHFFFSSLHDCLVFELDGQILGAAVIKPNHPNRGAHIANAAFMVNPIARGQGIADKLCKAALACAKHKGYLAMQFNLVVSTNLAAIHVWQKNGFEILATIPKAFQHKMLGLVDAHIMYRTLTDV